MAAFQSLSESEMEIMKVIWETAAPVTTAYLLEVFAHKGWKGQTMATFMTRLVDKGLLTVIRRGKANLYTPAISREQYRQREAANVIDSMYHGSLQDFLAAFYSGKKISQKEFGELMQWFDQEVHRE